MARRKSKTEQAKVAVSRLVQDEEVQKQLRTAVVRLREAWSRASGRPPSWAIQDKRVYSKVRDAAASAATATRLLRRQQEQPKRIGRKVAAAAAVVGGAAFVLRRKRASEPFPQYEPAAAPTGPVAAPIPPTPVVAN